MFRTKRQILRELVSGFKSLGIGVSDVSGASRKWLVYQRRVYIKEAFGCVNYLRGVPNKFIEIFQEDGKREEVYSKIVRLMDSNFIGDVSYRFVGKSRTEN